VDGGEEAAHRVAERDERRQDRHRPHARAALAERCGPVSSWTCGFEQ
jgi:hypothetical protein